LSDIDNLDELYARTFSTEAGQKVLSHLRQTTIERPCFTPGEDPSHGFMREGENEIVRSIERRIKRHRSRK
jgi:hypothetical protein